MLPPLGSHGGVVVHPLNISELGFEGMIEREWLAVSGLGGYASSTLCGLNTRKYHGLLVAAMSPPVRRMVILSHVDEIVYSAAGGMPLSCNEYPGAISPQGHHLLRAFSSEPFPRWAYQGEGFTIEKSLRLLAESNTVCLSYSLLACEKPVKLEIRPLLAMRPIHELMYQWNGRLAAQDKGEGRLHVPASSKTPEIFFAHDGEFHSDPYWYLNNIYRREQERGYGGLEDLWNPGTFRWTLSPGQTVHLICSTDPVEVAPTLVSLNRLEENQENAPVLAPLLGEDDANLAALIRAAAQFVVHSTDDPSIRVPQIISQYPWSATNGRSALIAFCGLFLIPGRFDEAGRLLKFLAAQIQDGLVPTDFAESGGPPQFTGVDTSLWFINAVTDYLTYTGDQKTTRELLPAIDEIIAAYRKGTKLGITCDADGLIYNCAPGVATSWMNAHVGDWVVTPRHGRTVEVNALWFNALRIAADLHTSFGTSTKAEDYANLAKTVRTSFNKRFWNPVAKCCFDVVADSGNDAAIRPNQLLSASLSHPVLAPERQAEMLKTVIAQLLIPTGLRTLSPTDPSYQGRYTGGVVARDRGQHQGAAYPWLLAHLSSAYLRLNGRDSDSVFQVRRWLEPCLSWMQTDGLGQLCELFDGDSPHRPGGAIASAISVGEILRTYARDILALRPTPGSPAAPIRIPPSGSKPVSMPPTA
jgi:predicted glycogen debranching enzyme